MFPRNGRRQRWMQESGIWVKTVIPGCFTRLDVLKDSEPVWHFIGTLQTRKVKAIIDHVSYIHSLDRLSLADEIQKRAKKPIDCFVQVNTSLEPSKHGMAKEEVLPFVKKLSGYENIRIAGLMTMAPFTDDEKAIRSCFRLLREPARRGAGP